MAQIRVTPEVEATMKAHAIEAFPNECCGFFFGSKEGDHKEATIAMEMKNSKAGDQRRRFEISPLDYMKGEQYALENGLDFLGIYHSHPLHPAIPSEHDRVQAMPSFSYIILSTEETEVVNITSWQLNDERQFDEEHYLRVKPNNVTN